MSVVNLADTASLLAEVTNVFHTDEDMGTAQKVLDTRAAIEKTCAEKQEEIKQIIREYSQTVRALEQDASYDGSTIEAEKKVLKDDKSAVIERIQHMEDSHNALQQEVNMVRSQAEQVTDQLGAVIQQRDRDIPDYSTKIALYETITDLKWDDSSTDIAGYVVSVDKTETKMFDFPKKPENSAQIADDLWNLVD